MNYKQLQSGIIVPEYYVKKPKRPIAFEFFCGAGGLGCGITSAGFDVVGANEYDAFASLTWMVNLGHYPMNIHYLDGEEGKTRLDKAVASSWGIKGYKPEKGVTKEQLDTAFKDKDISEKMLSGVKFTAGSGWIKSTGLQGCKNFWFGDIRKMTGKMVFDALGIGQGDLDLVTGGPPCQGFSRAGTQQLDDPRNQLVYEYARMIVELQPKTFIMENVPDIVNFFDPEGVPVIDKFCMLLQEGGYGRWEMIKKSLHMQTNSAAVIKGTKGNEKIKRQKPKPVKKTSARKGTQEQLTLYDL